MTRPDRRIDWLGLMRIGLHGLGLHPRDFWSLTPAELMLMLGNERAEPGFSRAALETLMAQFPDMSKQEALGDTDEQPG
jgi:uncharacterized phage protein (TIGR02216 family)